jgi:hypothetical protein
VRCKSAVLDGEICCVDPDGRTNSNRLLFYRDWPFLYAFDVLVLNGRDMRSLPLTERKRRLAGIMPTVASRVLFLDSIAKRGLHLFRIACERDRGDCREVGAGTYQSDGTRTSWVKIKSPSYTQISDGLRSLRTSAVRPRVAETRNPRSFCYSVGGAFAQQMGRLPPAELITPTLFVLSLALHLQPALDFPFR